MAGGKGGRPRRSPQLKIVAGTDRPDREAKVADHVPPGPMIAPADLGENELRYFGQIVAMLEAEKRASPHHVPAVALLARRQVEIERLSAVIDVEGDTYRTTTPSGDKMIRARPEVAMRAEAMRHAQSLLSELMLTPVSALKIAAGHKKEAGAFDDF